MLLLKHIGCKKSGTPAEWCAVCSDHYSNRHKLTCSLFYVTWLQS